MARRFGWRWALIGFVLTIVRGLCLSVGFEATLHAALLSVGVMYGIGWTCGTLWREAFE